MKLCINCGYENTRPDFLTCLHCSPIDNRRPYPKFGFDEDADECEDDYGNYSKYRNY